MISPLCLDHVVIPVHDAAAARDFYADALGLPLVLALTGASWGGHSWLMMAFGLGDGGRHLVTTTFAGVNAMPASPFPRDARHHAFAVSSVEAWSRWKARLSEARAEFWEEQHGDQRSLYLVDPSGNVLEITTPETPPFPASDPATAVATVERWMAEHG